MAVRLHRPGLSAAVGVAGRAARAVRRVALPAAAVVVALLIPLTGLVVAAWVSGYSLQPVLTDSMAPTHPRGTLLVVGPVNAADVEPGEVIVFEDPSRPGRLVAHRVVGRLPGDELLFRTRGDRNAVDDPRPVGAAAVRGAVERDVPGLGHAVRLLTWPANALVLVGLPSLLLAVTEVRARRRAGPHHCAGCRCAEPATVRTGPAA